MPPEPPSSEERDRVGLCTTCLHARVQGNARGSRFWRCARADAEPRFRRYPPLPVRSCDGHETGGGAKPGSAS